VESITQTQKAQGGTEYLVTMSVVLGIALICIALLTWPIGTTKDAKQQQKDIKYGINAMAYPDLLQGLVAYYKFDEGSGSNMSDGKGRTGSASGSWTSASKSGSALRFLGQSGYATTPNYSASFTSNSGTVLVWANRYSTQAASGTIIQFGVDRPKLFLTNDGVQVQWTGSTGFPYFTQYTYAYPIALNTWNCYAFAWDNSSGTYQFYQNGSLLERRSGVSFGTFSGGGAPYGDRAYIGGSFGGYPFNGTIDELYLFNRPLSQGEVQFLCDHPGYP